MVRRMSNAQGIGAPKGGRVHWFKMCLSRYIRLNYYISYNYAYHNYFLMRKADTYNDNTICLLDYITVVRTCQMCFRITGHNVATGESVYFSSSTSEVAALKVEEMAKRFERERNERIETNSLNSFQHISRY